MFVEVQTDDADRVIAEIRKALEQPEPPAISIRKRGDLFIATLTDEKEPANPS